MADEWYYWHDTDVLGPYSGKELAGLAATGRIVPTDTVWKGGIERGVPASRVQNLFPTAAVEPEPVSASAPAARADDERPATSSWFSGAAATTSNRRATAGKGALIVGQDGTTVKFRKKCTTCGFEDTSWRSIPITRGTTRVSFFCPKCRRTCAVEINGHIT